MPRLSDAASAVDLHYSEIVRKHAIGTEPSTTDKAQTPRGRYYAGLACLVVSIIVLSAVCAYAVEATRPKTYGARALLLYQLDPATDRDTAARDLANQVLTIRSRSVVGPAALAEHMPVEDLTRHVHVSVLEASSILQLTTDAPSDRLALGRATSIANEYVAEASAAPDTDAEKLIADQVASVTARIDAIQKRLSDFDRARDDAARHAQPAPPQTAEERALTNELDSDRQQLGTLQQQLLETRTKRLDGARPRLLTPPYVLAHPLAPRPASRAALGALAGIAIACIVVLWAERRRLKRPSWFRAEP